MKKMMLLPMLFIGLLLCAAGLEDLSSALNTPGKAVQAIHGYPDDVQDGNDHWVEVTSIKVVDNTITIVETWTNWQKSKSKTTLTGKINNGEVTGTWESSFSSGNWSYNFNTNKGQWNKTNSMFGAFRTWQPLLFKTVDRTQLKDGFYSYNF